MYYLIVDQDCWGFISDSDYCEFSFCADMITGSVNRLLIIYCPTMRIGLLVIYCLTV